MSARRRQTRVHHAPSEFTAHCDRCNRSFIDDRALEQHTRHSSMHNVCAGCDFDYITADEMEQCDCNESEEDEDESEEYYESGSAGTLSDDGAGGAGGSGGGGIDILADYYSTAVSSAFSNTQGHTHYNVPGAWNGGTHTDTHDFTSIRNPLSSWRLGGGSEIVYATSSEFESGSDSEVMYLEDSDEGLDTEEGDEEGEEQHREVERDGVQSPVGTHSETPYCQRCNREFRSLLGLYHHCRMSSLHPWYCWTCKLDFDREVDLEHHVAAEHGNTVQSTSRHHQQPPQQQQTTTARTTAQDIYLSSLRTLTQVWNGGNSYGVEFEQTGDTSSSTIHPANVPVPAPSAQASSSSTRLNQSMPPPPPVPPPPTTVVASALAPPGENVDSGSGASGKAGLVVSCPLCLEDAMALTSTLCGHVFCKECITAAIQHKPECPVCRAFTHIRSLHPIFLNVITPS